MTTHATIDLLTAHARFRASTWRDQYEIGVIRARLDLMHEGEAEGWLAYLAVTLVDGEPWN